MVKNIIDKSHLHIEVDCTCLVNRFRKDTLVRIQQMALMNVCLNCGKKIVGKNKKYCDNNCQIEYQHKEWIIRWKQGLETGLRGEYSISLHLKRYLFEKFNNKCCKCGWGETNPYSQTIPLEIDHIDGDYSNNNEENLQLLCPNCHSLTPTYKGANKGQGRKERKKYS